MSEETPKITTVNKEKDPRHVEAGKRLAALNKETKIHKEQQEDINDNKTFVNYGLILNVIGVLTAVVSLYYVRKECNSSAVKMEQPKNVKEEQPKVKEE